jgi:hypothetical protein
VLSDLQGIIQQYPYLIWDRDNKLEIWKVHKKSLKISKRLSEAVYRRRTDNTMAKRKRAYWSSPHSWLIIGFVTRVTWQVPQVDSRSLPLFLVWFVLLNFSFLCSVLYLLAIVLSVLLQFTDSDYSFGIFKLFLHIKSISYLIKTSSLGKGCSYILFNCTVIPFKTEPHWDQVLCSEQRFSTLRLYLMFGLYRILVYSVFGLDRFIQDSGLFSVWLRQGSMYLSTCWI